MTEQTATSITGVRTVAVPVADQDRALAFYRDALGFETRIDGDFGPGQRWIEVASPGAATSIALMAATPGTPTGVDTGIRLTSRDVDGDHAHLREHGADADPEVLRWEGVPPMFTFRDPDGNTLVVVAELAG